MKTKVVAVSLMLTFTSCAVFAQTDTTQNKDSIPTTDSIPKKDSTVSLNTLNFSEVNSNGIVSTSSENNTGILSEKSNLSVLKDEMVYIFPKNKGLKTI